MARLIRVCLAMLAVAGLAACTGLPAQRVTQQPYGSALPSPEICPPGEGCMLDVP